MTKQEALDILKLGHNVYLTGAAGSGKTYLLNQYIKYLRDNKISVGITATTGIAATHMGGMTIHSFVGMGIRESMTENYIAELLKKHYLRKHFKQTNVLIIDEISMLHAHLLDLVDMICRAFKKKNVPFGGMQIVMCGDFFQLPPVKKYVKKEADDPAELTLFVKEQPSKSDSQFVYDSSVWNDMQLHVCYLDEQHRQEDRSFLRVLNDIRNNEVSEMTTEILAERLDKEIKGYAKPTRLFTHNIDVDAINLKHLAELKTEAHEYMMDLKGNFLLAEVLKKTCLAPEKLLLKKGASVMFVKNNFEEGYVNGTLGVVIGFSENNSPIVRTFDGNEITVSKQNWAMKEDDLELAAISQIPLRLAWAITVHKSQGMSLDAAEIDLSKSFLPGMGYVALSRVRSLSGLRLMGMNQMALLVNPDVAEKDKEFLQRSDETIAYLSAIKADKKKQMHEDFLRFLQQK